MKRLGYVLLFFLINQEVFCQFNQAIIYVADAKTNRDFMSSDGVIITVTGSYSNIYSDYYDADGKYHKITYPDMPNYKSETYSYRGDGFKVPMMFVEKYWSCTKTIKFVYDIKASGYEPTTIINDGSEIPTYHIKLIPKNQNINMSGSLSVNQTQPESLGVLSTEEMAKTLGVPESEIIKLIQTHKLKGKKIGEKYFVRKEDFASYMKQ